MTEFKVPNVFLTDWLNGLSGEVHRHLRAAGWKSDELMVPVSAIKLDDQLMAKLIARLYARQFFKPLTAEDYCCLLVDQGRRRYTAKEAERIVRSYQEMGRECDPEHPLPNNSPLFYLGLPGFTFKTHAPQAGPCHQNFQDWDFPDEPTGRCLYSWVPRLVPGSIGKTVAGQRALLAQMRQQRNLPRHHLEGFGKIGPLAGLILKHQEVTDERTPVNNCWVRTETCYTDGPRLQLCWDLGELHCDDWLWAGGRHVRLGVFALGVEPCLPAGRELGY